MSALGKLVPLGKESRPVAASTAHDDSSMDEDDFMKQIFDPNLDESPAPTKPGSRPVARPVQHDTAPAAAAFGRPSAKPAQTATVSQSTDALESLVGKKPTNQNTAKADNQAAANETLSGSSSQPDLHSEGKKLSTKEQYALLKQQRKSMSHLNLSTESAKPVEPPKPVEQPKVEPTDASFDDSSFDDSVNMDAVLPDSSNAKPNSTFSTNQKNKAQTDSVLESLLAPVPPGAAARPVRRVIPPAVKQPIADSKPAIAEIKTESVSTINLSRPYSEMSQEERVIVWAGWLNVDRSDATMFAYAQRGAGSELNWRGWLFDSNQWRQPSTGRTQTQHPRVALLKAKIEERRVYTRLGRAADYSSSPEEEMLTPEILGLAPPSPTLSAADQSFAEEQPATQLPPTQQRPGMFPIHDMTATAAYSTKTTSFAQQNEQPTSFFSTAPVTTYSNPTQPYDGYQTSYAQSTIMQQDSMQRALESERIRLADESERVRQLSMQLREADNRAAIAQSTAATAQRRVVELQAELADSRHHFELRFKAAAVEAEADRRRAVDLAEARVREENAHAVQLVRADLDDTKRRHVAELESLRQTHADQLAALRRQQTESVYLNSLAKQVTDSAASLQSLQSSVALQRSAGDRDRESALELRESTLAAREEKLRTDAASIAEREAVLQRTQRQYEADRTTTETEMRQLQALQKDMVMDSAAWRDTLAADRAKIQSEWTELNAAKRRWDIEQHSLNRDIERSKAEAQKRLEAATARESDVERMRADVLRQLEHSRARVRLEAEEVDSARAELERQRAAHLAQRQALQDEISSVESKMEELSQVAAKVNEESALVAERWAAIESENGKAAGMLQQCAQERELLQTQSADLDTRAKHLHRDRMELEKERTALLRVRNTILAKQNELQTAIDAFAVRQQRAARAADTQATLQVLKEHQNSQSLSLSQSMASLGLAAASSSTSLPAHRAPITRSAVLVPHTLDTVVSMSSHVGLSNAPSAVTLPPVADDSISAEAARKQAEHRRWVQHQLTLLMQDVQHSGDFVRAERVHQTQPELPTPQTTTTAPYVTPDQGMWTPGSSTLLAEMGFQMPQQPRQTYPDLAASSMSLLHAQRQHQNRDGELTADSLHDDEHTDAQHDMLEMSSLAAIEPLTQSTLQF